MRRRLPIVVQAIATYIGLSLLILLMLFAFKNDLVRVFRTKDVVEIKKTDSPAASQDELSPVGAVRCLPRPVTHAGPGGH